MISKKYQFPKISEQMYNELENWWKTHNDGSCSKQCHGAIGGAITFEITPTSIGDFVEAKCICGQSGSLLEP